MKSLFAAITAPAGIVIRLGIPEWLWAGTAKAIGKRAWVICLPQLAAGPLSKLKLSAGF